MNIKTVVIPAAGWGTRFLPYTKTVPKELLPLGRIPALQHVIEEGVASEIRKFILIANKNKQMILDYFSPMPELDNHLEKQNKTDLLSNLNQLVSKIEVTRINQTQALGLGHAVLQARDAVDGDYFGVMLPDDIVVGNNPEIGRLIAAAKERNASIIAVQEVPRDRVSSYGVIQVAQELPGGLFEVADYVEKPKPEEAPSNLCSIGRFVLSPKIFDALEQTRPGAGGEIQLTDGITRMMASGEKVYALKVAGKRFDTGTPQGWLEAVKELV